MISPGVFPGDFCALMPAWNEADIDEERVVRLLFEIDKKDYDPDGKAFVRPSSRAIILKKWENSCNL